MAPKKAESAALKAKPGPAHASYQDMIIDAIVNLKDRNGTSRQSLKKYVKANNQLNVSDNMFDSLFNKALKAGVDKGAFAQPKGPSGGTKLAKKRVELKKPTVKKDVAAAAPKKPAAPAAPAKKAAPKKAAAAKSEPKAAASSTAKKPAAAPKKAPATRKAPAAAVPASKPERPETVLTKTKSGRVTKTQKPAAKKATPKKAAPKKAASATAKA
ncbi:hypothetical protein G6O67_004952 [Ophiocordyceps sinensis]|uniref:Histone H1 n=1 Tax=Ophiocordyceps sinensis TaxID=72228 RepID=A0A8H4V5L9_9HYPO|nr:hypothetical protein G6O67_004952 [Ophiocordyceps sinensis]